MYETLTRSADVVSVGAVSSVAPDVEKLLDFLPVLYPGGSAWLARAAAEVEGGRADAFAAVVGDTTVGVGFGALKPSNRYKIRTLFVSPADRGRGIGRMLLVALTDRAKELGAYEIYVTAATTIRDDFEPMIGKAGFNIIATESSRYGCGRDEDIFVKQLHLLSDRTSLT